MKRNLSRFLLLLTLLTSAAPAFAGSRSSKEKEDPAKARLEEGMKLFGEKRYDEAIVVLRQGYAISNKPEFLYALGQVERIRGDCNAAIVLYRSFLDSKPKSAEAEAANLQIERCEKKLRAEGKLDQPKPEPVVTAPPPKPEPVVEAKPEPKPEPAKPDVPKAAQEPKPASSAAASLTATAPEHRPWYKDTVGDVLLGSGAVAFGAGTALFLSGRSTASSANQNLDSYVSAKNGSWQQPAGAALMGGGAALIAGSVVRYMMVGRSSSSTSISAGPTAGAGGEVVVSGTTP